MKRMTKTGVLREIAESAKNPHSLLDFQRMVIARFQYEGIMGVWITDGTISRRLREWGAHCERGKDGIFRYSLRKPQQPNLFKEER